ncbi:galactose-3-O-sulfotransferase 2-like [Branchiostoma floridae x Branchiostoma belcheri]
MAAAMIRLIKAFVFLSCMTILATCFWFWQLRVAQRKSSDVRSALITANEVEKVSGDSCKVPVTNLMFIKTEDTVSEGTARILLRFAYNHRMAICHQTGADHFLLTHSRIDASDCKLNKGKSNTISMYQPVLPGTRYIGIISEPVTSFRLQFFDKHNLEVLGLENHPNPLGAYLDDPEINERSSAERAPQGYVGQRNKQALELGFPPSLLKTLDTDIMDKAIKQLNERYTFVIISENYEESIVMLKRKLCLDMYYILHSINKNPKKKIPLTDKQLENHRRINTIDYRMYDFFNRTFWKTVQEEEGRGFSEEVAQFRKLLADVRKYCSEENNEVPIVEIPASRWNNRFLINHRFCKELKRTSGKWTKDILVQIKNQLI